MMEESDNASLLAEQLYEKAEFYRKAGDRKNAVGLYRELLKLDPKHTRALAGVKLLDPKDQFPGTSTEPLTFYSLSLTDAEVVELYRKAEASRKAGDRSEALVLYREVLRARPDHPGALMGVKLFDGSLMTGSNDITENQGGNNVNPFLASIIATVGGLLVFAISYNYNMLPKYAPTATSNTVNIGGREVEAKPGHVVTTEDEKNAAIINLSSVIEYERSKGKSDEQIARELSRDHPGVVKLINELVKE